jgi:glycosyltransferase involved in cell wall biosynthesis
MENRSKRIIIITPGFPVDETDSTCIPFQQSLVLKWKEMFPEFELIIFALQYPYHNKPYKWREFFITPFGGRNQGGLHRFLLRQKIIAKLRHLHSEKKIDGCLSFWYNETAWAGNWMSKKYGIPHYCWLWGQDVKRGNPYPSRLKLKSGELLALSDLLQERMEEDYGIRPYKVIAPGVEDREESTGTGKREFDLLGVGSLIPLKNYSVFVETVVALKKTNSEIKALLIGTGQEKDKLELMISTLGLENNLQLAGERSHSEVLAAMANSKILVHPSTYEGFGMVCLEAISCGMQVISFVQPMKRSVPGWHVVQNKTALIEKAGELLVEFDQLKSNNEFPLSATISALAELFGSQTM